MAEYTILDMLDFITPSVGYEDADKHNVCACCGTHYIVGRGGLAEIKGIVKGMYEALKLIKRDGLTNNTRYFMDEALIKVEGKD